MAGRHARKMAAAVRPRRRTCRSQARLDEQKGFQSPAQDGVGLSIQVSDLSPGLYGGTTAVGPRGRVKDRTGEPGGNLARAPGFGRDAFHRVPQDPCQSRTRWNASLPNIARGLQAASIHARQREHNITPPETKYKQRPPA